MFFHLCAELIQNQSYSEHSVNNYMYLKLYIYKYVLNSFLNCILKVHLYVEKQKKKKIKNKNDVFFDFLERLKPKVLADSSIDEQLGLDVYEEQYEQTFKKTLDEYEQIYVFCFDVIIYRDQPKGEGDYLKLYSDYEDKIKAILQKVDGLNTLIHYLVKLEPSQEFGINLHFVLILKETKYFPENTFILKFKKELAVIRCPSSPDSLL